MVEFNWQAPMSFLKYLANKNFKEVVIYSNNSIEQVPHVQLIFFAGLLQLPMKISVIHNEPVLWQIIGAEKPKTLAAHYNKQILGI